MVQNSRGKAEDALKKVPDIEDSITEAERKTEEARDALSGAENDANDALSIAEMAEKTAQNASDVSYVNDWLYHISFFQVVFPLTLYLIYLFWAISIQQQKKKKNRLSNIMNKWGYNYLIK